MRTTKTTALAALAFALPAGPAHAAGKVIYHGSCPDRGICVLADDGSAGAAPAGVYGDLPRWSPDGSVFAYQTAGGFRAATPTRTIITTRARLRFDVVDRSGIAGFRIVLKPHYPHGRCRRTANDLGAPVRCTGAASLEARSAGGLRALRHRLRPGTYELFAQAVDVLGNRTKFAVRGRLRLMR